MKPHRLGVPWLPIPRGLVVILPFVLGSCGPADRTPPKGEGQPSRPASFVERLSESPRWIDTHRPELSDGGYNLALYNRRIPFLMDMNGTVVRAWPEVRASARARLLPTGHLAVISERGHLKEYDWEGRPTWTFKAPESSHMLHHDFARLRNGNYLALIHWPSKGADYLLEIDRSGKEVWRWNSHEAIADDFWRTTRLNLTHTNSVQELLPTHGTTRDTRHSGRETSS